jgi:hypothetical protein
LARRLRSVGHEFAVASAEGGDGARLLFLSGATAALTLSLAADHVRAGFELLPSRVRGARKRLSDPARALELTTVLEQLPEQFIVALAGDRTGLVAPRTTMDDLRTLFERVERLDRPLWIGWAVERAVAVEHAALLEEQLGDALAALAGVFVLFTADGDAPSAALARSKGGRRTKAAVRDEDEREPKKAYNGATATARRRPRTHEDGVEGDVRADRPTSVEGDRDGSKATGPGRGDARPPLRAYSERRPRPASTRASPPGRGPGRGDVRATIERGAHVRILEGPFAGKVGVVHELDGKGGARVMLGLLAVRLNADTLTAHVEGRRRPVLSTSHRKPVPVRS